MIRSTTMNLLSIYWLAAQNEKKYQCKVKVLSSLLLIFRIILKEWNFKHVKFSGSPFTAHSKYLVTSRTLALYEIPIVFIEVQKQFLKNVKISDLKEKLKRSLNGQMNTDRLRLLHNQMELDNEITLTEIDDPKSIFLVTSKPYLPTSLKARSSTSFSHPSSFMMIRVDDSCKIQPNF